MLARILALALPGALVGAPSPAPAAEWTASGAGFGHGVGMSQYGAYGMAQEGDGYRRILAHYYRGTEVGDVGGRPIRVLLREGASTVSFTGAVRLAGRRVRPGRRYTATRLPGRRVRVRGVGRFAAPLVVFPGQGGLRLHGRALNGVADGTYRGTLELSPAGPRGMAVVNRVSIDAYVQGVVPGEMPASWDLEALKAQAVAARSYALTTDAGGDLFDQYADTRSQMYRGVSAETRRSNAAVADTGGEVITFRGAIATAYYFSTSGGQTESVEHGFPGAAPVAYLRSVQDPADRISPLHRWRVTFTQRQIERRLRGLVRGRLRAIRVVRTGESPRIVEADVVGSRGRTRVSGATLRDRLGLRSTWVRFAKR